MLQWDLLIQVSPWHLSFQDFMEHLKQASHVGIQNPALPLLFVQKNSAFYPCSLAFIKRRRNCITLLLSISEQDSTSRPYVPQSFKVVVALSAWLTASSHLPHMVKAGKIHFSNTSLQSKSFSFPQEVLQTGTTGPPSEARATADSRDPIHK